MGAQRRQGRLQDTASAKAHECGGYACGVRLLFTKEFVPSALQRVICGQGAQWWRAGGRVSAAVLWDGHYSRAERQQQEGDTAGLYMRFNIGGPEYTTERRAGGGLEAHHLAAESRQQWPQPLLAVILQHRLCDLGIV